VASARSVLISCAASSAGPTPAHLSASPRLRCCGCAGLRGGARRRCPADPPAQPGSELGSPCPGSPWGRFSSIPAWVGRQPASSRRGLQRCSPGREMLKANERCGHRSTHRAPSSLGAGAVQPRRASALESGPGPCVCLSLPPPSDLLCFCSLAGSLGPSFALLLE